MNHSTNLKKALILTTIKETRFGSSEDNIKKINKYNEHMLSYFQSLFKQEQGYEVEQPFNFKLSPLNYATYIDFEEKHYDLILIYNLSNLLELNKITHLNSVNTEVNKQLTNIYDCLNNEGKIVFTMKTENMVEPYKKELSDARSLMYSTEYAKDTNDRQLLTINDDLVHNDVIKKIETKTPFRQSIRNIFTFNKSTQLSSVTIEQLIYYLVGYNNDNYNQYLNFIEQWNSFFNLVEGEYNYYEKKLKGGRSRSKSRSKRSKSRSKSRSNRRSRSRR